MLAPPSPEADDGPRDYSLVTPLPSETDGTLPGRAAQWADPDSPPPEYEIGEAAPSTVQQYTIGLDADEAPKQAATLGEGRPRRDGTGRQVDVSGSEAKDASEFAIQILMAIFEGLKKPFQVLLGPFALIAAFTIGTIGIGANNVSSAGRNATSSTRDYLETFDTEQSTLIDMLVSSGANDKLLLKYQEEYTRAETQTDRLLLADQLYQAMAQQAVLPEVVRQSNNEGRRAQIDTALNRISLASSAYVQAQEYWRATAGSGRGKFAVMVNAAEAPPEVVVQPE
jgi:hypothetical protein